MAVGLKLRAVDHLPTFASLGDEAWARVAWPRGEGGGGHANNPMAYMLVEPWRPRQICGQNVVMPETPDALPRICEASGAFDVRAYSAQMEVQPITVIDAAPRKAMLQTAESPRSAARATVPTQAGLLLRRFCPPRAVPPSQRGNAVRVLIPTRRDRRGRRGSRDVGDGGTTLVGGTQ